MFPIFINDGSKKMPDDDIFYIICKEGVYLKKKMGVMESMAPVKNISILKSVEATARMHIAPIPGPLFAKVISFFNAVYKEHRSEAIVLIFYDEETKKYKIFPPYQKVSYATVDYNKGIKLEGWQMIGTIHSHAAMSAFHSGVDDDDEKSFDGLHITIGDNDDDDVSISASIVVNGSRFLIDPLDYIEDLALTVDIDKTEEKPFQRYYKLQNGVMVPAKTTNVRTYRKLDKRYISTVPNNQKQFNQQWMDFVEHTAPVYNYGGVVYGGNLSGWGPNFNPYAWSRTPGYLANQNLKTKKSTVHSKQPKNEKLNGPTKIKFPPHDQEDYNPCEGCVFINHKIDWVMQQVLEEAEDPRDYSEYKCEKCESEFKVHFTQEEICPMCKTDKYLVDISPEDDNFNYDEIYQCLRCRREFSTDETDPTCPICKKNDELTLVEVSYDDEDEEDTPYQCKNCGKKFLMVTQEQCPHCGVNIIQTEAEERVLSDIGSKVDGITPDTEVFCINCKVSILVKDLTYGKDCPFCGTVLNPDGFKTNNIGEFLSPEQEAIQAAQEADVKRLPIPDQGIIPINNNIKETKGAFAFMRKRRSRKRKNKKRGSK